MEEQPGHGEDDLGDSMTSLSDDEPSTPDSSYRELGPRHRTAVPSSKRALRPRRVETQKQAAPSPATPTKKRSFSAMTSPATRSTRIHGNQSSSRMETFHKNRSLATRPRARYHRARASTASSLTEAKEHATEPEDLGDIVIPPWQTLPYHILLQIFTYASDPLLDDYFQPRPSVRWLLAMSRTCRAFTEPALTALYRCPPLLPVHRAHGLRKLLSFPVEGLVLDYARKVRRLAVDVVQALTYSSPGEGHLDLADMVCHLPRLEELEIYNVGDRPPYRDTALRTRWNYPDQLFSALDESGIRLRSWRWNGRMSGPNHQISQLESFHRAPSFQHLERIAFFNHHDSSTRPNPSDRSAHLAVAISVLPKLKHLAFESCTIITDELLPLLPTRLRSLALINCPTITSELLHAFLVTHGHHLEELILDHNPSLSLSFLPDLALCCPRLRRLKMDLQCYSSVSTYSAKPNYDALLRPGEVPTWPSALQDLELLQLSNWNVESADAFFESLTNAAATLPQLRRLVLRAILKIGWRDRATFRDNWVHRLEHIFLRTSAAPNPQLRSLRPWRARRRKAEAAEQQRLEKMQATADGDEMATMPTSQRRSVRLRHEQECAVTCVTGDEDDSEEGQLGARGTSRDEGDVQGLCNVVDVMIDNMRPMEVQFKEDDFLDDEASGDEDWNGQDSLPGDERYAW